MTPPAPLLEEAALLLLDDCLGRSDVLLPILEGAVADPLQTGYWDAQSLRR